MQRNDHSFSTEALLDASSPEGIQLDGISYDSSDLQDRTPVTSIRASPDLQHVIFNKLHEVSKQNLEVGLIDQGLQGFERCTEQLLTKLKGNIESPHFIDFLYTTLNYLNDVALRYLRASKVNNAIKILNKCLEISHPEPQRAHPDVQSLTYNHLGCCYRRIDDLDKALAYLRQALYYQEAAIEAGIQGQKMESSSVTHINLCAVLSQKGDHQNAIEHARKAVSDCTQDLLNTIKNRSDPAYSENTKKKATMLSIAYCNLGVEANFCKDIDLTIDSYQKAYKIAEEHRGALDQLTIKFEKSLNEAKLKRRASPPRVVSPKRQKSPVPKRLWKPQLPRPHSAHQFKKFESVPAKAESPVASSYLPKRLQAPSLGGLESLGATPTNSNSATLPKMPKTPSGQSAKSFVTKPGRKAIKALTPNESIKFFFPMGNMPPLVESEKTTKEILKPQKTQKPQRPMTANVHGRGVQDHRTKKPVSTSSRWDMKYSGGGNMFDQDEIMEEDQKKEEKIGLNGNKHFFNNFKDFMTPKVYNIGYSARNKANDSTKWTSIAGEPTDDPYSSLKRVNKSSGLLGRSDEVEMRYDEKKTVRRTLGGNYLSRKYAVNTIQRHMRGWYTRRVLRRSGQWQNRRRFWAGLSDIIREDLENKGKMKEYYIVMMYDTSEGIIYVEMKDLESRVLYKGRIEKKLGKEELKQVCWKLRANIAIENNRIVFNGDVKEEVMDEISERTDESDVGPLIEALEKEAHNILFLEEEQREALEDIKVKAAGSKESYDETSKSSSLSKFEKSEGEREKTKKSKKSEEGIKDVKEQKNRSSEKLKEEVKNIKEELNFKNFRINISQPGSMEEDQMKRNKNTLFTKKIMLKGQVLTIRVETHYSSKGRQKLLASIYDAKSPERFETIDLPSSLLGKKDLSLEEVLDFIVIDLDPFRVSLNVAGKPQDSFSSYNDASIALDISVPNAEKDGPLFLRSESLRKPTIQDERRMLRGFSSGTIDSPLAFDRDQFQYLGLGLKKQRTSGVDDSGRFSAACKVSEASSGREYSNLDRQSSRRFKESRTTLSPRDGTHRSEAEGSIMLRVSEGIASHCKVAYTKGKMDILVKYAISSEENAKYEEVRIGLDELGLGTGELEKDLVLEKVRSLLGKRLKYRQGKLVYESKPLSRENTQREEDKKVVLSMPKIEELNEEAEKKNLQNKDSNRLRDEGDVKIQDLPQNKEVKTVQVPKISAEEKRKSYGDVKSDSRRFEGKEEGKARQETQETRSVKSIQSLKALSRQGSEVQSKKDVLSLKEMQDKIEGPVPVPEALGVKRDTEEELEKTYVETFGAIHTEESSLTDKVLRKIEIRHAMAEDSFKPGKKAASATDTKQVSTPRMYQGIDNNSPTHKKDLVLPLKTKQDECSPKIKSNSNESSPRVYIHKDDSPPSVWSPGTPAKEPLEFPTPSPREEKKGPDGRRRTLKRSNRSYTGDIPRIVIHNDKEQTIIDYANSLKAMSMGTLENNNIESTERVDHKEQDENKEKEKKEKRKREDMGRISFGGVEYDSEEWSHIRSIHKGEKLTARFNDLDGSKRHSITKASRDGHDELPAVVSRIASDTVQKNNPMSAGYKKGSTGKW